ncbi:MAG TPA: hypothetical protein VGR35_10520 [Tepidisphaeraceae bacterium]|nr:hypothetical protein [Tepidisphaeraceae bacterium]
MSRRLNAFVGAILFVLVTWGSARAQDAADAPADPVATAHSVMMQLDQLRVVEANNPPRVLELFKRGTDALAQARRQVVEDVPAPAPATAPGGRSRKPDPAQTAASAQRRLNLCRLAFMQAELHRRAAAALPADHPERAKHLDLALAQNKALRIDYRDLVAGRLGYAGEARVHRARVDLAQADAVLANVTIDLSDERRIARESAAVLQVQRVLWLERVETALARNLSSGNALARSLANSPLIQEASPAEQAALAFLTAQAAANDAIANNDAAASAIAQQLRDPALAEGAPEHQRLALLAKLSKQRGVALTAAEQLQWARLQAWAGLQDAAIETYAAATRAHAQDVTPADWLAYGSLLHAAGRVDAAADALAKGLESLPADAPQRVAVLQAIAAGRLQRARQPGADAAQRQLAVDALWQLANAATDVAMRRDALRSWAHLQQQAAALEQHLPALEKFSEDVKADPYLYLLVANARWQAANASSAATTQRAATAQLASEITTNLKRLLPDAEPELAPSLILLMAQVTAAAPGGARAALDVLAQHDAAITPDAPATPQILALKLRLLMDLGLAAEAESLASQLQASAVTTATALKLADMLADRHAGSADVPPASREQVVQLVSRGLANHAKDADYRDSALSAATSLLKVRAFAEAQQILDGLRSTGTPMEKDPNVALLYAAALQGQGKVDEAQQILTAVARENPRAGDVHLAAGRLQQQLQQWESAAAAYRFARKELATGGEPWWQATLGLAETLIEQGNADGAQELLRVANAMYRSRAPASLLPRIDTLLKPPLPGAAAGTSG